MTGDILPFVRILKALSPSMPRERWLSPLPRPRAERLLVAEEVGEAAAEELRQLPLRLLLQPHRLLRRHLEKSRAPATPAIPGCDSRTTGFSTSSGVSCVGNSGVTTSVGAGGTYNFGTKTLKNGSRGDAVKQLQMFLNATLNLGLKLDGILGPKTIAVIKKWQADNGLVADGLVGAKTKAKMNAMVQ